MVIRKLIHRVMSVCSITLHIDEFLLMLYIITYYRLGCGDPETPEHSGASPGFRASEFSAMVLKPT